MATAEEILAAAFESEAITVDWGSRTLIVPSTLVHLGVESDDDVLIVPFIMPRYYGSLDLAGFEININYTNANGDDDVYDDPEDIFVDEEEISFKWRVGRFATMSSGPVEFSLCLKKYNTEDSSIVDKELNTQPVDIIVLKGKETIKAVVQKHPEIIAKLCDYINGLNVRITRLEKFIGLGENYGDSKIEFIDGVIIISPGGPSIGGGEGSEDSGDSSEGGSGGGTNDPEEVISYNLFGKWVFNENIYMPDTAVSLTNTGMKTGSNFGISVTKLTASSTGIVYVMSGSKKTVAGSDGVWLEGGYRYIDFGADGVKVDELLHNWFVTNAVEYVDEEIGETYRLYITGGYGVSIYTNGSEDTPLHVTADTVECRGIYKFKFASDNVDCYFKSGAVTDEGGEVISLEIDSDGWHILTQNTTVVVTAGGENSRRVNNYLTNATTSNLAKSVMLDAPYKAHISPNSGCYIDTVVITMNGVDVTSEVYANGDINIPAVTGDISISVVAVAFIGNKYQLEVLSPVASFVYINLDEATPVAINVGDTVLNGVAKIKFAGANISGAAFFVWSDGASVSIDLKADENGWYTLTRDICVSLEGRSNVDPDANILYGKWTFNEQIELPEEQVTLMGGQIFSGSGYGETISAIAAQAGTGVVFGNAENDSSIRVVDGEGLWIDQRYRSVDLGNAGEVMDDAFYRWFITNATEGGQEFVTVTSNLTNCTLSNSDKFAIKGKTYGAILQAPTDGKEYKLGSVKIVMNGVNVTATSYSAGIISISEVTGNIEITANYDIVYKLSGKWLMNETLDCTSGATLNDDGFTAMTGTDYSTRIEGIVFWMTGGHYWLYNGDNADPTRIQVADATTTPYIKFSDSRWRYLDFGTDGVAVDSNVYNWFLENGKKQ